MESLPRVLSEGTVCRKSAIDDAELSSWRRNGQLQRLHYYSDSQSNNCCNRQPLLFCGVDHPASSFLQGTPQCRKTLSLPCTDGKSHVFYRSGSGSQLATTSYVYAGARFSESPSPKLLPLPPRRWLDGVNAERPTVCGEMTRQLKSVLRVE